MVAVESGSSLEVHWARRGGISLAECRLMVTDAPTRPASARAWPAVLVATALMVLMIVLRQITPIDLLVYRWGGELVLDRQSLYAPAEGLPFTYPPFAALLFTPFAVMPVRLAVGVFYVASSLGLVALVRRAVDRRLSTGVLLGLAVAALALEPVWSTYSFGQVNLVIAGVIAADLLRRTDRPWAGVWLGVVAGVKLTPIFLVAWLVLAGRLRTAAVAVASAVGTALLGLLVLPADSRAYWTEVLLETDRIGTPEYQTNQSIKGVVARFVGPDSGLLDPAWFVVSLVVGLVAVLAAARLSRRGHEAAGLSVAAVGMLLASPVSWSHHWVWVVLLVGSLVFTAARTEVPALARWSALALAGAMVLEMIWWVPGRDGVELEWNAWQVVVGNVYVWCGLVLLAALLPLAARQVRALLGREPR